MMTSLVGACPPPRRPWCSTCRCASPSSSAATSRCRSSPPSRGGLSEQRGRHHRGRGRDRRDRPAAEHSTLGLHIEAARNAVADAGLTMKDIDGIATVSAPGPVQVAHALGIYPDWMDGTGVGGTSFLLHVRHAAAAIRAGYAKTILITHGESGRSRVGAPPYRIGPRPPRPASSRRPYGTLGPTTTFTIPALRYMKEYGLTHEQLAYVAVAQRQWAAKNPRAMFRDIITVEDVLASRDGRLPVPPARVLPGHRRRRRARGHLGRPRGRLPQAARARARHRGGVGDPDDLPDDRLHRVADVPPGRPDRVRRGGHHHRRRQPPDDLRRVRARPDLRPGGARLRRARARPARSSPTATPSRAVPSR